MLRFAISVLGMLCLLIAPAAAQETAPSDTADTAQSSVDLLLNVIEDDAARAELIERLRAKGVETGSDIVDTLAQGDAPPEDLSFGRRIAIITQDAAEDVAEWATNFWTQLSRAPAVFDGLSGSEAGVLM